MAYSVKEIFYTLQGEGAQAGRAAVFCRFAGCNLWSGREEDRASAVCRFCDTDFVGTNGTGGGKFAQAEELADAIERQWPLSRDPVSFNSGRRFVVCTGGEPLLQIDQLLIAALHARGFEIAVETNGTIAVPAGRERIDWICVSPKAGTDLMQRSGNELKLVYPQTGQTPEQFAALGFGHWFLQPMDVADPALRKKNTELAIRYCMEHPQWRLSVQSHKVVGIR
jgi:7-carboxy-7-deazaguanine synthase (Cx14CxxC type)